MKVFHNNLKNLLPEYENIEQLWLEQFSKHMTTFLSPVKIQIHCYLLCLFKCLMLINQLMWVEQVDREEENNLYSKIIQVY